MKNSSRLTVAKGFCLLALISIMCGSAFAADHSSETDDQLIAHLQAAVTGNPRTGSRGDQNLGSAIAMAATQGDYVGLERTFMQLKVQLSSDPDSVAIIELLLTRFQAAEAAQTSKRIEELNSITKDLVDKFNSHAPARDYDELLKHISDVAAAAASPYNNMRTTAGAQKIEDTRTFVAQWQEYLIVSAQGNPQQTASILSQLIQLTTHFTVIPRSTLLNLEVTPGTLSEAAIAKEAAEKEKKEQFGKKFIAEIDAAKVPSDLDAVLAEDGPLTALVRRLSKATRRRSLYDDGRITWPRCRRARFLKPIKYSRSSRRTAIQPFTRAQRSSRACRNRRRGRASAARAAFSWTPPRSA